MMCSLSYCGRTASLRCRAIPRGLRRAPPPLFSTPILAKPKRMKLEIMSYHCYLPLDAKAVEAIVGEDKDWIHGKPILQKPSEFVPDLNEEAAQRSPGESHLRNMVLV